MQHFYDDESRQPRQTTSQLASLDEFIKLTDQYPMNVECIDWAWQCTDLMLHRFFSSHWLIIIEDWSHADCSFLLIFIANGKRLGQHQLAMALLQNACLAHLQHVRAAASASMTSGVSNDLLQLVSLHCICVHLPFLSGVGRAHFVPDWMIDRDGGESKVDARITFEDGVDLFFSDYKHVKCCPLSCVVFEVVLSSLLKQGKNATFEQLLLELSRNIEAEYNIKNENLQSGACNGKEGACCYISLYH